MTLDFGTLTAAGGLVAFVSGLLLIFAWTQYDDGRPALFLGISHLLGACAITFLAVGAVQESVAPKFAQPVFTLAAFLATTSILAFEGRTATIPPLLIVGFGVTALIWLTIVGDSPDDLARIIQLAIASILFITSAWLLWNNRQERLSARLPMSIVLLLHGLLTGVGLAEAILRESLPSGVPSFSQWYGLIHVESMLYFIGTTLFMVALLKERSESGHRTASLTDPLTGLANRRAFFQSCDRMLARCQQTGAPCTILVIDLDRFKAVNDTFGHSVGDRVLQVFANVSKEQLRTFDVAGRLGGEEFAVLLPRTHSREGAEVAVRLKEAFAAAAREIDGHNVGATLSIGVTVILGGETAITEALERADAALYRAKLNGRDRIEVDAGIQSVRSIRATGT